MIRINHYQKSHEMGIDLMMKEISTEFIIPVSSPNSYIQTKTLNKYWVAEEGDLVIGTVGVIKLKNRNAILKRMFVKKKYRGSKIGVSKLLLQTAMNWLKKEQITNLFLGTRTEFKAAQKFYVKNDFHQIDRKQLPMDFVHHPTDDVFYQLDIKN